MTDAQAPAKLITPWTRVIAALLLLAIVIPGVLYVAALLERHVSSWPFPWYGTIFLAIFLPLFLPAVASVALFGRTPHYWSKLEGLGARDLRRSAPDVRQRMPEWTRRVGLLIIGAVTASYAAAVTVAWVTDYALTSRRLIVLVLIWSLALGVVVALSRWWRQPRGETDGASATLDQ